MCPPPSCPDYNSILNTFKSEGYLGFVSDKLNIVSCYVRTVRDVPRHGEKLLWSQHWLCQQRRDLQLCLSKWLCEVCSPYWMHFSERIENRIWIMRYWECVLGLLITGGEGTEHTTEIFVPTTNTSCNFVRMPNAMDEHSQHGFQVCGGDHHPTTCDTWMPETGRWTRSQTLRYRRDNHHYWASKEGAILLGGGGSPTTTEMLSNVSSSSNYGPFGLKYSTRLILFRLIRLPIWFRLVIIKTGIAKGRVHLICCCCSRFSAVHHLICLRKILDWSIMSDVYIWN